MNRGRGLSKLRVLELPGCSGAAYAGRLLAHLGASVAVIEAAAPPDATARRAFLHAGKQSILATEDSLATLIRRLAPVTDVVLAPTGPPPDLADVLSSTVWVTEPARHYNAIDIVFSGAVIALTALTGGTRRHGAANPQSPSTKQPTARSDVVARTPPGLYRAMDGWVIGTAGPWDEATVERLMTGSGSSEALDVDGVVAAWVAGRTKNAAFHQAQLWRLPFAPVLTIEEVVSDRHFQECGAFPAPTRAGCVENHPFPAGPFRWENSPGTGDPLASRSKNELGTEWRNEDPAAIADGAESRLKDLGAPT